MCACMFPARAGRKSAMHVSYRSGCTRAGLPGCLHSDMHMSVGCWGLFATNLQSLLTFGGSTSPEALRLVCVTNALMHFLWGAHNLHIGLLPHYISTKEKSWIRARATAQPYQDPNEMPRADKRNLDQWRRPAPILLWSLLGACGAGCARNIAPIISGSPNDAFTIFTWVWEWLALGAILYDFVYFLRKEHRWGMALKPAAVELC